MGWVDADVIEGRGTSGNQPYTKPSPHAPSNQLLHQGRGNATVVLDYRDSKTISLALYLLPFAGIAFLWFMGVIRDRLGEYEDRFFATVFLGSGLLFVAMIFTAAAEVSGIITVLVGHERVDLIQSGSYYFGRAEAYQIMNIYGAKMAGAFMTATCTITLRTRTLPRWRCLVMRWRCFGYALALILLFSSGRVEWLFLLFPLCVLRITVYMLIEDLRGTA
jgi:hypothetical protein